MKRYIVGPIALGVALLAAGVAHAQTINPARVDVTVIPGGAIFFTEAGGEPDFGSYTSGVAVSYHLSRLFAVEGEVSGNIGLDQDLAFNGRRQSTTPPNMLAYSGNVVFYPFGSDRTLAPYATGGAGGLTLYERPNLGLSDTTSFFTGNVGGGVKYALTDRFGLRADYRFLGVASKDDAPAFFGGDTRYAHRVYGGLVVNLVR